MISRLRGILIAKKPPQLLVEVQGVGYEVQAPMSTIFGLPELGKELILYTEFIVREDAHKLFGFLTEFERELFNKITKVSGVGPKLALAILSGLTPENFVKTVQASDIASLVALPGVGKKTAERLVVELRDKFGEQNMDKIIFNTTNNNSTNTNIRDAKEALVALGYSVKEAHQAIVKMNPEQLQDVSSEEIIKTALSRLINTS